MDPVRSQPSDWPSRTGLRHWHRPPTRWSAQPFHTSHPSSQVSPADHQVHPKAQMSSLLAGVKGACMGFRGSGPPYSTAGLPVAAGGPLQYHPPHSPAPLPTPLSIGHPQGSPEVTQGLRCRQLWQPEGLQSRLLGSLGGPVERLGCVQPHRCRMRCPFLPHTPPTQPPFFSGLTSGSSGAS